MKENTSKQSNRTVEYERCVVCKRNTGVPVDKKIDERRYYVCGSGQLCKDCYFRVYLLTHKN